MMAIRSNHRKNSAAGKCHLTLVYDYLAQFISLRPRRGRHWEDRSGQIEAHWGGGEKRKQRVCETLNNYQQLDRYNNKVLKFFKLTAYWDPSFVDLIFWGFQKKQGGHECQIILWGEKELKDNNQLWKALQLLQLKRLFPAFHNISMGKSGKHDFSAICSCWVRKKVILRRDSK